MSKRRVIDSRIRTSQTFALLSYRQRDLWQGLIAIADDQGRLPGVAAFIRSQVWPFDDITIGDTETDLKQLEEIGNILRYEVNGGIYIQLVNWWKYQQPQWAGPSDYPPPPGWDDRIRYHGPSHQIILFNWNKPGGDPQGYPPPAAQDSPQNDLSGDKSGDKSGRDDESEKVDVKVKQDIKEEDKDNKTLSSPIGESGGEFPQNGSKPKTEFILAMERLEGVFAKARGSPLPDWSTPKAAKASNRRWRMPMSEIYRLCGQDIGRAERLVLLSVQHMIASHLTFDAPDQILKVAGSLRADLESGKLNVLGIELTEEERTRQFLANLAPFNGGVA